MNREAADAALAAHAAGGISAPVALMRLGLTGAGPEAIAAWLAAQEGEAAARLHGLALRHAGRLAGIACMARIGADHRPAASAAGGVAAARLLFDRLLRVSPETSVAAYALGDPGLLAEATEEVLAWLRAEGLLRGAPRVLDLGCGIGRLSRAVAPQARRVLGLDASPGMVRAARARHAGCPRLRFARCSGRGDLSGLRDAGFDLVLAVDVFPYLAQAGRGVMRRQMAEAARVLRRRRRGHLVILNLRYGTAPAADRALLAAMAARSGLALARGAGCRPFALWDASAFVLRRR